MATKPSRWNRGSQLGTKDKAPSKEKTAISDVFTAGKSQSRPSKPPKGIQSPTQQRFDEFAGTRQPFAGPSTGVQSVTGDGAMSPAAVGGNYQGGTGGGTYGGTPTYAQTGPMADLGYGTGTLPQIYDNPEVLATEVLRSLGIENTGLAMQLADALYPALYSYMIGAPDGTDLSDNATLNHAYNQMEQMMTPGGQMTDMNAMMQMILGADDESLTGGVLNLNGLPADQVDAVNRAMQAARYGMNPLAQRAYQNALQHYGTQYMTDQIKNPNQDYNAYLAGTPLANWSR